MATLVENDNQRPDAIREAAILTQAYVASDIFNLQGANQLQLKVAFTLGSSSGAQIKVEFSDDKTNWFQESKYSVSGSDWVHTAQTRRRNASASLVINIPVISKWYRVSSLAVTDETGTSLAITGMVGNI